MKTSDFAFRPPSTLATMKAYLSIPLHWHESQALPFLQNMAQSFRLPGGRHWFAKRFCGSALAGWGPNAVEWEAAVSQPQDVSA
jgi:hypothetical protein